jgi:hypothetical protein
MTHIWVARRQRVNSKFRGHSNTLSVRGVYVGVRGVYVGVRGVYVGVFLMVRSSDSLCCELRAER